MLPGVWCIPQFGTKNKSGLVRFFCFFCFFACEGQNQTRAKQGCGPKSYLNALRASQGNCCNLHRYPKFQNAVVLNAFGRRKTQKTAKKHKKTKARLQRARMGCKRTQKERLCVRFETTRFGNLQRYRRDSTNRVFVKRGVWPSRNFFRHRLGVCLAEAARHRHAPVGLVKTFATIAIFDSAIMADLDSLITPSFLPQ